MRKRGIKEEGETEKKEEVSVEGGEVERSE